VKLTSLNIKGFKSFPEKTSIHFNENVTGVVGPNGSGKSNIVDAIRWVLGEQKTSSLRSEKMDNLIFNGSKERKASGLAEVSLSFENNKGLIPSEFKDITITRMLHRDGESEYRINNVPCRLKDITGLFMDTGVASDSYAIIELKMIDEILNDRENSRRRLFEQASGVSKYKIRKRETLNKLTLTDTDLARVEDLLFEIGNNLKELESQARKAKRFYALKEEYKALSLELARMQVSRHRETFQQIEAQKLEQDDKRLEIETRITQLEAEIAKEKTALIEKEKNLTSRQKRLNELINAITKKESEKNLGNEQVRFLNERVAQLQKQTGESETGIVKLAGQLEQINEKRIQQKTSLETFVSELETKQQEMTGVKLQNDTLKAELDTLRDSNQSLERQVHDLEKKTAINTAEKENLLSVISQNTGKNKELEGQISQLRAESETVKNEIDNKNGKLETLLKGEEKLQSETEKANNDLRELEQTLSKESRKLDSKKNEYSLNKSLVDSLEGFPESIKFLKRKSETAREAQLLSDIFYCGEQYRAAIENYLEPFLNYFVVADMKEAYESIHLLSDASIGRANFFILSKFENYRQKSRQAISNAIPALDVVEIDDKYKKLAAFLLDNVYLIPEAQFSESEQPAENAILLSVNGKYMRTGYSLSGGALGLFEGMRLGRIKNLDKLKDEIRELETLVKDYESQVAGLQNKISGLKSSSNQQAIEAVREDLSRTGPKLVSTLTKIENFQTFIAENITKNSGIASKIRQLEIENEKLSIGLNDLLSRKERSGVDYEQLLGRFNAVSESLAKTTGEFNEKNIEFHRQQNLLNSLEQEAGFAEKQIGESRARIEQAQQEIKLDEEKIAQQQQKLQKLEQELISSYTEKENYQKTLTEVENQYYEARGAINELEEQLKTQQKNRAHIDMLVNEIKDRSTEMRIELNAVRERLSVEFNVNLDNLMEGQPEEGLIEEEVREKALKIKSRLENFGEINPMAVEAFDEMQKRFDFITAQKNDLIEAKKSLMETINEIEDSAKEKFMEAFEKARENFQNIFRSLFSEEDTCDMILLTPDNPLESEIEIIAKPKGKKPQTINQLSGGEKSLTALAILFALYLLKPAPFCVLDEVDAPLDDANIDKFNKTIRHFSKESQFILVTHNKQTMASVDVIYGVTMPENGVSRVVPVDFRSLN